MKILYRYALVLLLVHGTVFAQEKLLDKNISIVYKDQTLKSILTDLSKRFGISISYSSNQVPLARKISVDVQDIPLAKALDIIFEGTDIVYLELGNQIVLKKKKSEPVPKTGTSLKSVPAQQAPVGSASIQAVPVAEEPITLDDIPETAFFKPEDIAEVDSKEALKEEYVKEQTRIYQDFFTARDTSRFLTGKALKRDLKTAITLLEKKVKQLSDSLEKEKEARKQFREAKVSEELQETGQTEGDSTEKPQEALKETPVQISFIYPMGTNGRNSPDFTNRFSFNVLSGYNGGVKGAEIGSLVNLIKNDVYGTQIAGLVNLDRGHFTGAQVAGITNLVGKNSKGFQAAGIGNLNKKRSEGAQVAGVVNITGDTSSVFQASGVLSYSHGSNIGGQFSGVANISKGSLIGPQAAGVLNLVYGNAKGAQVAGVFNVTTKNQVGAQIAGVGNIANKVHGVQIAGIINTAKKVDGSQIGLINLADSVSGAQIGLLSFSRDGFFHFELSGSETLYPTFSMKTGRKLFHNILSIGMGPVNGAGNDWFWWYGYGLGFELDIAERLPLNIDVVSSYVTPANGETHRYNNMLYQAKFQLGYKFAKRFSLFAGPVINIQLSTMPEQRFNETYSMAPYKLLDLKFDRIDSEKFPTFLNGWIGFSAGVRI